MECYWSLLASVGKGALPSAVQFSSIILAVASSSSRSPVSFAALVRAELHDCRDAKMTDSCMAASITVRKKTLRTDNGFTRR